MLDENLDFTNSLLVCGFTLFLAIDFTRSVKVQRVTEALLLQLNEEFQVECHELLCLGQFALEVDDCMPDLFDNGQNPT